MAELETDVLVIGLGPAGAAAAITAADRGAHVTVIEKTSATGGNCRYSGGFIWDVDGPDALAHLEALCFGKTDTRVLAAYLEGLHEVAGWIEDIGGATFPFAPPEGSRELPGWPRLPAADRVNYRLAGTQAGGPGGRELWRVLAESVERRVAHVLLQSRAVRLRSGDGGTVDGCLVELRAGELNVRARHGTILACGGFEWDAGMRDAYLEPPLVPVGHPGNTGDGIRLAQQVGAALWHMSAFFGWFAFETDEFDAAFPLDFHGPGFIWVDADGRRFADETGYEVHDRVRAVSTYLPRRANYPHLPLYAIFDEPTRLAGPLHGVVGTPNDYRWTADNAAEVERGWIASAGSVAGLAEAIGVDRATLSATIDAYNAGAASGDDPEHGRAAETLVPLELDRLYAIRMVPGVATASGGPRRDARARVLREDGQPVPRLFAAGGCGSIWGHLTQFGGGLTDAIVFGRIAGEEAARG
jgi:succinate dehydrogenase/fumarate reductase flavoprotein subunit